MGRAKITCDELVGCLQNVKKFSVFLGAGASISSGIPGGNKLKKVWQEQIPKLGLSEPESTDYSHVFEARFLPNRVHEADECFQYVIAHGESGLGWWSKSQTSLGKDTRPLPRLGYYCLSRLMMRRICPLVVTTNFDDLISDALLTYCSARPVVFSDLTAGDAIRHAIEVAPVVVKYHGAPFWEMRNTVDEVGGMDAAISRLNTALERALQEIEHIVVVGHSGGDPNFVQFLDNQLTSKEVYWCTYGSKGEPPPELKTCTHVTNIDFDSLMVCLAHARDLEIFESGELAEGSRHRKVLQLQANKISRIRPAFVMERGAEQLTDAVRHWLEPHRPPQSGWHGWLQASHLHRQMLAAGKKPDAIRARRRRLLQRARTRYPLSHLPPASWSAECIIDDDLQAALNALDVALGLRDSSPLRCVRALILDYLHDELAAERDFLHALQSSAAHPPNVMAFLARLLTCRAGRRGVALPEIVRRAYGVAAGWLLARAWKEAREHEVRNYGVLYVAYETAVLAAVFEDGAAKDAAIGCCRGIMDFPELGEPIPWTPYQLRYRPAILDDAGHADLREIRECLRAERSIFGLGTEFEELPGFPLEAWLNEAWDETKKERGELIKHFRPAMLRFLDYILDHHWSTSSSGS